MSIIVPYEGSDAEFESTILSVLENRPVDFELLITHRGDFRDPYGLGTDEAVVIKTEAGDSLIAQINLATSASCSPIVQILRPGTTVSTDWAESGLELLRNNEIHAVCSPIQDCGTGAIYLGLDGRAIPHRRITSSPSKCVGPLTCGSLLRRKTICALGGWFDHPMVEVAELELAILLEALELSIDCLDTATIQSPKVVAVGHESGFEIGRACGSLACAYAAIPESGIEIDSLVSRLGHLASGLMNPKTVAERLGWVLGIGDRSLAKQVHSRFDHACDSFSTESNSTLPMHRAIPTHQKMVPQRKAA